MTQTFLGFQTIDELTNYIYGRTPDEILKAAGGIATGTTGVYNPIYGAMAWANFNLEANVFSALPKFVWDFSGWRIFTGKGNSFADAGTNNNSTRGGTVEGGLIAAPVSPVVQEVYVKPRILQYTFQVTELMEYLVENSRDDLWGSLAHQRLYAADQAKELYNQMLTQSMANMTSGNYTYHLLDLESLYQIVSSEAEGSKYNSNTVSGLWNPWSDTASIFRTGGSAATTWDSYVNSPANDQTNYTADVLTDSIIRSAMAQVRIAGGKEPTLFVGGQDTYSEIQSVYMNAYRIQNTTDLRSEFNVTVNGIDTFTGTGVGLHISTVYGLPFIPSKDVSNEGVAGQVSDLFILNTNSDRNAPMKPMLGLQVLKPIVYYEASKRIQGWPFINGKFVDNAMYESLMQTTCRNFKAQGKLINIKSGI